MSYCVHCGVELDATASFCPLCHVPVQDPIQPVDRTASPPFPTNRKDVLPASKKELAILLTVMLASVGLCCGILNLFIRPIRLWSLYIIGAVAMLWVWLVPSLLLRKMMTWVQLLCDGAAIAAYVLLIAIELDGWDWYLRLALPIVVSLTIVALFLCLALKNGKRSILSTVTLMIGTLGVFLFSVEFFGDHFFHGVWHPGWSIIVLACCVALIIPLIVVRRIPALRNEARRRFHM